uniref:Uncharacterized protein n=1 Tax=Noctiluca scintillans TaxID=2966 RepID=A0A7S1F1S4_NOCSC|mmetsp:Transcript_25216/g.66087  ORF Transcript_25216/g.66087 Transcript_25216/m.66087 type:complete len:295 (+) Transcript_25216:64-948(+)
MNSIMCVGALVLLALPTATSLRLTTITDVQCAGSGDLCSGDQCCPGYEGSDFLTFPCPTATAGFDQCQTIIRYPYEPESDDTVSAVGDPHVTSITGEKFDLWRTGWSTFVQIPKDVATHLQPKLLVTGNVEPYGDEKCAPAYLKEVMLRGTLMGHHHVLVRSGSLEGPAPFGVSVNYSSFEQIWNANGTDFVSTPHLILRGKITEDEPGVWGPDAKLSMKVGDIVFRVKQHTEGRFLESRSMLDLSVTGLDKIESVGGWLGAHGHLDAGTPPAGCSGTGIALLRGVRGQSFKSQ